MNLYRVLIVDDEQHVVEALTTLLESQIDLALDLYAAYSGIQAIEIIEQGKIDLLITDIQMPDMSGIELVDRVNQIWPICKTIFLTAYANFDYACAAIKKHVISYILKTEDDETIVSEIRKVLKSIDDELDLKQIQRELQNQFRSVNRQLYFDLLKQTDWTEEESQRTFEQLGFQKTNDIMVLLLGVVNENINTTVTDEKLGKKAILPDKMTIINEITGHYLKDWLQKIVCEIDDSGNYMWLLQFKRLESPISQINNNRAMQQLSGMLEIIQSSCLTSAGIELSFIISAPIHMPVHLANANQILSSYLLKLINSTDPYVFSCGSPSGQDLNEFPGLQLLSLDSSQTDPNLMLILESGDRTKYKQYVSELYQTNLNDIHGSCERRNYRQYCDNLITTILTFANKNKLYDQTQFCNKYNELFHFWRYTSWLEYENRINELAETVFSIMEAKNDELFNHMIEFIKKYISAHLSQDISLMRLAEVTGYNATYLSGFFHKQTGEQLNKYISRQKLNLIQKLLANTHLSIEEVAEKVGFSSRSYFNHFLKKETGLTPSNYRLEILNSMLKTNGKD